MAMNKELKEEWLNGLRGKGRKKYRFIRRYLQDPIRQVGDAPPYCGCAMGVLLDILSGRSEFTENLRWGPRNCSYKGASSGAAILPKNLLAELGISPEQQKQVFSRNDFDDFESLQIKEGEYPPTVIQYIEQEL